MARHPTVTIEVHECPVADIYRDLYTQIPGQENGSTPIFPLPILRAVGRKWEFPIGDYELIIPVRFCPYCGKDLENG